jgi:hypothetical protein
MVIYEGNSKYSQECGEEKKVRDARETFFKSDGAFTKFWKLEGAEFNFPSDDFFSIKKREFCWETSENFLKVGDANVTVLREYDIPE